MDGAGPDRTRSNRDNGHVTSTSPEQNRNGTGSRMMATFISDSGEFMFYPGAEP